MTGIYGVSDPALGDFLTLHVKQPGRVEALTYHMARDLHAALGAWLDKHKGRNIVTANSPKGTKRTKR